MWWNCTFHFLPGEGSIAVCRLIEAIFSWMARPPKKKDWDQPSVRGWMWNTIILHHITPWHGWWALEDAEDFSNSILSKLTEEEMGYDAQVVLRLLFCWFPEPFSSSSTKEFTQKTAGEEFANAWHSGFSDTGFGQTDPYLAARTWPFSSAVLKSLLVDIAVVPWSLYQLQNWIGRTRQISINFLLTFWFEKDFIVFTFPRNE